MYAQLTNIGLAASDEKKAKTLMVVLVESEVQNGLCWLCSSLGRAPN
jgi:hypothetical protein